MICTRCYLHVSYLTPLLIAIGSAWRSCSERPDAADEECSSSEGHGLVSMTLRRESDGAKSDRKRLLRGGRGMKGGYDQICNDDHDHGDDADGLDECDNDDDSGRIQSRTVPGGDGSMCVEGDGGRVPPYHGDVMRGTPWLAFFTHPASATLLVAYWTQNWIGYLILSELPTFFTEELGFNLKDAGVASMAPYIAQYVSTLGFGWGFQWLQRNRQWRTRDVRQWAQYICLIGASVCLMVCGFVDDAVAAMLLMVVALAMYGACQSGCACAFLDISPNYSSTLNTIANLFASIAGMLSPLLVSWLTDRFEGVWGWRYVFVITALQCAFSSILWYFYQTSDVVPALNDPQL
jgi:hypothetical protein